MKHLFDDVNRTSSEEYIYSHFLLGEIIIIVTIVNEGVLWLCTDSVCWEYQSSRSVQLFNQSFPLLLCLVIWGWLLPETIVKTISCSLFPLFGALETSWLWLWFHSQSFSSSHDTHKRSFMIQYEEEGWRERWGNKTYILICFCTKEQVISNNFRSGSETDWMLPEVES